jgi:hypothetical protein
MDKYDDASTDENVLIFNVPAEALERAAGTQGQAWNQADFQSGITAGICGRRNGYRSNCAAKFLNFACPVGGHAWTALWQELSDR